MNVKNKLIITAAAFCAVSFVTISPAVAKAIPRDHVCTVKGTAVQASSVEECKKLKGKVKTGHFGAFNPARNK